MVYEVLLGRPWGWVGPVEVTDEGATHFELRIRDLPDFFVAGVSRADVLNEALPALRAFLDSYPPHERPVPEAKQGDWQTTVLDSGPPIHDLRPFVQAPPATSTAGGAESIPAFRRAKTA